MEIYLLYFFKALAIRKVMGGGGVGGGGQKQKN